MTTKVYHVRGLTDAEAARLNANGWDGEPRFARYADITSFGDAEAVRAAWQLDEYELVAEVESNDLDDAYRLTNHIERSWTENAGVTVKAERVRSTSVGDVLVDANGAYYIVASLGFTPLAYPDRDANDGGRPIGRRRIE